MNLILISVVTIPVVLMTMKAHEAGVNLKPVILLVVGVMAGLLGRSAWRRIANSELWVPKLTKD